MRGQVQDPAGTLVALPLWSRMEHGLSAPPPQQYHEMEGPLAATAPGPGLARPDRKALSVPRAYLRTLCPPGWPHMEPSASFCLEPVHPAGMTPGWLSPAAAMLRILTGQEAGGLSSARMVTQGPLLSRTLGGRPECQPITLTLALPPRDCGPAQLGITCHSLRVI